MQVVGLFILTGLAGAVFGVGMDVKCSVGASGAVFGFAGALVGLFYRRRHEIHMRDRRIGFVLLIYALFSFALGVFNPVIDNYAHLGGFLSGLILGFFLIPKLLKRPTDEGLQPMPLGLFVTGLLVLALAGVEFLPRFLK
jgi:rhomboid protease GluP